ncbi:MAG: MBL fold metallo-hydrolase [Oscillospiraceae bacterium]|nr:MBL fold metallo-hydrolase [Oscillospiraceae bacterium]
MKFIIIGSGGCVCTPKPLCQCQVCVQARAKGYPYARCGCSLYLEDVSLLVDTPEDIAIALNNADIKSVDSILYSHADPDHTMGMRIMEQLRLEWLDYYDNIKPLNPITVYARAETMDDLNAIKSKYGSLLDYYEYMSLIRRQSVDGLVDIGNIKITLVPIPKNKAVSTFVFESNGKKLVYAPCDCVPFPNDEIMRGADILVIGNTFIGDVLKNGKVIMSAHPLRKELHSFEGVLEIKEQLGIKRVIITHIEEFWGKSYDDYIALEKKYHDVAFAYDGMSINI